MSRSPHEHRREALARQGEHADLRARVRGVFEGANGSRGYRYAGHEPGSGDDPAVASEKAVRRIMREEGLVVAYAKKGARCSSYEGEISDVPENLVGRDFRAPAPNEPRPAGVTGFGLPVAHPRPL